MLSCIRYQKRLGAYLDGELSARKQAAVERHVARCAPCSAALSDLQGLQPLMSILDVPPVPANLTSRILTGAYEPKRRSGTGQRRLCRDASWYPSWLVKGVTATALIAGLAMGTYMGWSSFRAGGTQFRLTASISISNDSTLYAFDTMRAAPDGSIEAATLKLLGKRGEIEPCGTD